MIDVIIPAYNAHSTIKNALDSIVNQINRDMLCVYIIDDGSTTNYRKIIKNYEDTLDIHEHRIENSGPGMARQIGLNMSNNEFIVFLDADDYFFDEYALQNLIDSIYQADLVQGFIIDKRDGNNEKSMISPYCYLHGKMYRRSIIEKYDINFDVSKRKNGDIYEDSTFNQLYTLCCKKISTVDKMIYIYEYNPNSLTQAKKVIPSNLKNFVQSMNWLVKEIKKRKIDDYEQLPWLLAIMIYHCYFNYLMIPDKCLFVFDELNEIRNLYEIYHNYLDYDNEVAIFRSFVNDYSIIPNITVYEFISKIK